jgi:hypothetical protein
MHETDEELDALQELLDRSAAAAGPHMSGIIGPDRRVDARDLCSRLQGMRLLVLTTVTADGRPMAGPVDAYFLHGAFHFSSGRDSVRMRHLAARPVLSATHLPGEEFAVTVHGRAELYELNDPDHPQQRRAMLDHYLPLQGPSFQEWLDRVNPIGARVIADKIFTFQTDS